MLVLHRHHPSESQVKDHRLLLLPASENRACLFSVAMTIWF
jgi:hypothetical protein